MRPINPLPVRRRTRYSAQVKEEVRKRYKYCRTTADKELLASELNILDEDGQPSVSKLYNLASRLGAAGSDDEVGELALSMVENDEQLISEDPDNFKFSKKEELYLQQEFGRRALGDIARHLRHSETALLYKARQMGLRKPVKYWDAEKAARWFGMSHEQFKKLASEGLDFYPIGNQEGNFILEVVSTSSLGRWLSNKNNAQRLEGADQFFIREISESLQQIIDKDSEFEACIFLSHGHVCMNAYSDSFGMFCTNNERYQAGRDPACTVKTMAIEDLRPDYFE